MVNERSKKLRVMAVDNEPDTVMLVKEILEDSGYDVVPAFTGEECLTKLKKSTVDLILLDVMMPDMSGWDIYERVRKNYGKIKIAFLSVLECSPARKQKLKDEGVADYINKPFTSEELVRRVDAILK